MHVLKILPHFFLIFLSCLLLTGGRFPNIPPCAIKDMPGFSSGSLKSFPVHFFLLFGKEHLLTYPMIPCAQNLPVHVLLQVSHDSLLFQDDEDRLAFLRLLDQTVKEEDLCLYGYCLMQDHIHLLLHCPDSPDSCIYKVKKRYSLFYRRRHRKKGPLFRTGFRKENISDPADCLCFICRDPVRSGLSGDPFAYPWSSAGIFTGLSCLAAGAALFSLADAETWRARLLCPSAGFYMECPARRSPSREEIRPILRRICSPEEEKNFHYLPPARKKQILGEMRGCSMTYISIQESLNVSRYEIDMLLGKIRGRKKRRRQDPGRAGQ